MGQIRFRKMVFERDKWKNIAFYQLLFKHDFFKSFLSPTTMTNYRCSRELSSFKLWYQRNVILDKTKINVVIFNLKELMAKHNNLLYTNTSNNISSTASYLDDKYPLLLYSRTHGQSKLQLNHVNKQAFQIMLSLISNAIVSNT